MPETISWLMPYLPYLYLAAISLVSILVTLYDKAVAGLSYKLSPKGKKGGLKLKIRIPEFFLLLLSLLGGSVAMLLTMLLSRHKTKKVKFMLGIPAIIVLQGAALWFFMGR